MYGDAFWACMRARRAIGYLRVSGHFPFHANPLSLDRAIIMGRPVKRVSVMTVRHAKERRNRQRKTVVRPRRMLFNHVRGYISCQMIPQKDHQYGNRDDLDRGCCETDAKSAREPNNIRHTRQTAMLNVIYLFSTFISHKLNY